MSEKLGRIRAAIYAAAGGETAFKTELPFLFRQAIDELIDAPRTRRLRLSDLEPNEKAVLGIKVEAALRQFLDFPRGKLDFLIAGYDVDVKFTSSNNSWMIPPEAVGQVCLLAKTDERRSIFSIGLIEAKPENLTKGQNRDKKLGVSKAGRETVDWFAFEQPFPSNIWESVSEREAKAIFQPSSGTERIVALFSVFEGQSRCKGRASPNGHCSFERHSRWPPIEGTQCQARQGLCSAVPT